MALWYSRTPVELREVILRDKPRELIAASAKATVPVLVLPNGRVIDESYDIMKWALAQSDPDGWLDIDLAAGDALVERNDFDFKPNLDRYKYPDRYPGESADTGRDNGLVYLNDIDGLCRKNPYLFGKRMGMIDVAVAPFVRQFASVEPTWFKTAVGGALNEWLDRFVQLDIFLSVMHKYPRWSPGDDVLVFGTVPTPNIDS